MKEFNFEVPGYILEELEEYPNVIPFTQTDSLIILVNIARMNDRINDEQAKELKEYIKEKSQ